MRASSEAQRQRILAAAAQIFARDGLTGARVDQIAAAAGVNKRMLYHHVGPKTELFAAVLMDQAGRLDEQDLTSRSFWSLLLEEATHSDTSVLLKALVANQVNGSPGDLESRLAALMFRALLPAAAELTNAASALPPESEAAAADAPAGPQTRSADQRKPRLRMMPQVTAAGADSTRSPANRSK